jgi:hypothetical protein
MTWQDSGSSTHSILVHSIPPSSISLYCIQPASKSNSSASDSTNHVWCHFGLPLSVESRAEYHEVSAPKPKGKDWRNRSTTQARVTELIECSQIILEVCRKETYYQRAVVWQDLAQEKNYANIYLIVRRDNENLTKLPLQGIRVRSNGY